MIIEEKKCVRFGLGMLLKVKAVVWRAGFNPADCSSSIKISNHMHLSKIFSGHKTKKYWFSKSISEYKNLTEADETIFTADFYLNPNFRVWIHMNSRANTHEKQLLEIPPSEKKKSTCPQIWASSFGSKAEEIPCSLPAVAPCMPLLFGEPSSSAPLCNSLGRGKWQGHALPPLWQRQCPGEALWWGVDGFQFVPKKMSSWRS